VAVDILPAGEPQALAQAARRLAGGGLVAIPTETVYGLAAHADDGSAVARVFDIKGRPRGHPLIVHVRDGRAAARYAAQVGPQAQALMQAFWPGPLTLILPRRAGMADVAAAGLPTVGLRCPSHPDAQALLDACAQQGVHGLAVPSANRFGKVSPTRAAHVASEFEGEDLLVLDGGACPVGIESTIVDLSRGRAVLLRPGMIGTRDIESALGAPVTVPESDDEDDAPKAPGTLASHYAPRAKVRLMDAGQLRGALEILGAERVPVAVYARAALRSARADLPLRRMPDDAAAAAQELFAVLRELDDLQVTLIWVETPPEDPAWDGVRDRLRRASAA